MTILCHKKRHHNNHGVRQAQTGSACRQLEKISQKLKIPFKGSAFMNKNIESKVMAGTIPKVFVVQDDGNKNLTPAMQLGEICVLAQRDISVHSDPATALSRLRRGLKEYNPERDYVLLIGDPLLIGATVAELAMRHGSARCLKWDRQNMTYHTVIMQFPKVGILGL